jgi:hypothetical protein
MQDSNLRTFKPHTLTTTRNIVDSVHVSRSIKLCVCSSVKQRKDEILNYVWPAQLVKYLYQHTSCLRS